MFDKEALIALQEGESIGAAYASLKDAIETSNGSVAALPSDYKLHDLEKFLTYRRRARGLMTTSMLDAFAGYTKAHAEIGASVFVNAEEMSATAVLNIGIPEGPGHADNKAKIEAKRTAALAALLFIANGAPVKQAAVAEFLEDWPDEIKCSNTDGVIATSKAVAAVRKLTIESMRKVESEDQQLSASRSAFESVQATSKDPIPTIIEFCCQPYADLHTRTFAVRLGIRTDGDKPGITLRIIKFEQHTEEMAKELADLISASFHGDVDGFPIHVLVGKYSKAE